MAHVLIVGAGFAGLNAAKILGRASNVTVTVIDRRNHHLFQPLLYQVAMAGLSPADIAAPIRSILSADRNIRVLLGTVTSVDRDRSVAFTDIGEFPFDYLIQYISTFTTLAPGDVIATGTPTGAGARFDPPKWLKPGDRVEVEVSGIGTLANTVIDEPQ